MRLSPGFFFVLITNDEMQVLDSFSGTVPTTCASTTYVVKKNSSETVCLSAP